MTGQSSDFPLASSSRSRSSGQEDYRSSATPFAFNAQPAPTSASTSNCCGTNSAPNRSTTNPIDDLARAQKRQRLPSPSTTRPVYPPPYGPPPPNGIENNTKPRPSSFMRDMSPPIDRRVPPINSAECCLGIVACDERGEIVGWTSDR
jgi:hypothetical protein